MFYDHIDDDLLEKYDFYNYNNAVEVIAHAYPDQWWELCDCFRKLSISIDDLKKAGGNETDIPKKFDDVLYPYGWREIRMTGDLHLKFFPRRASQRGKFENQPYEETIIERYIDGHNIDFLKDGVAFDLEWNSKDQTFDRDIMAMRTFYECGIIGAGVIVTRSEELNDIFKETVDDTGQPIMRKYGASTTWIGKLIPRLDSRRNGGCPILAVAIRKECIEGRNEVRNERSE